jgi:hypothetical protein
VESCLHAPYTPGVVQKQLNMQESVTSPAPGVTTNLSDLLERHFNSLVPLDALMNKNVPLLRHCSSDQPKQSEVTIVSS